MRGKIFLLCGLGLLALGSVLAGCKSADHAHEGRMASVEIVGYTATEIRAATAAVFAENGYEQPSALVFEKIGSRWDKWAYGTWSGNPVWIRIRVTLRPRGVDRHVLSCDAYLVRDRNAGFMEEEQRLVTKKRRECERLLTQIKARLEEAKAAPEPE